ncbi:Cytochrome c [Tenacibaculum sp. MAR_2009_124]|uniref:c-type cytochrome n=1 Tax=Tenacibaculum sp. MAR_2009_124 TaxID=1250059 RepID=UPI0008997175|nr:cytochrome c [Tenacibaculum sp. MAR_2009_124]SEB36367.1 Cytochrome c [Tenacibaculum sp. MAR_2009_124]
MKRNKIRVLQLMFCIAIIFSSCSDKKEKKQESSTDAVVSIPEKIENKQTTVEKNEIVDLVNKGIGPIKSLELGEIDKELAKKGAEHFKQKCTSCHKANKKFLGPPMKGLLTKRSPEWIMNMMLNPMEMTKKDPIAKQLLKDYNNLLMVGQNLSEEDARSILEFVRTL